MKLIGPNPQPSEALGYQPMMAVLIAMTTATIAGIFLFMTLRIDRGTRLKAQDEVRKAQDEVRKAAAELEEDIEERFDAIVKRFQGQLDAMAKKHEEKAEEIQTELRAGQKKLLEKACDDLRTMYDEGTKREVVRKAVAERITEDGLRSHVEAVLMIDSNGKLVADYVKRRTADIDAETAKALVGLLNDAVKSLSRHTKAKRKEDRAHAWAKARAAVVGWWHRVVRRRR